MFCGANSDFVRDHLPVLQETWPIYPPECDESTRASPSVAEINECRGGPAWPFVFVCHRQKSSEDQRVATSVERQSSKLSLVPGST
eukprot:204680-Amphidinium_carterae.1